MTASLQETLLTEQNWPHVVVGAKELVDQELDARGGVSGTAIKVAYKAVTAFAPGYYQTVLEIILPQATEKLEPFWADFSASGGSSFGDYLANRGDEVSGALLSITDDMAQNSDRGAVVKAYKTVRGSAAKNIQASLPNLGAFVQKYAG